MGTVKGPHFGLHNPIVEWFIPRNRQTGFTPIPTAAIATIGASIIPWPRRGAWSARATTIPHFIWVLYSDVQGTRPGRLRRHLLPEDDLLGLIGKHPTQSIRAAGVRPGSRAGHAFGLPHPADIVRDKDALMWAGFYHGTPRNAYLTDSDKAILLHSPSFSIAAEGTEAPKTRRLLWHRMGLIIALPSVRCKVFQIIQPSLRI